MKTIVLLLLMAISFFVRAQNSISTEEMKTKLDSIITEADILYRYEQSALTSLDIVKDTRSVKKEFGDVFVYQLGDSIKAIILGKENQSCISEFSFYGDMNEPKKKIFNRRELSADEERLLGIKRKIQKEIIMKKYPVIWPDDFALHQILIPVKDGYKLYIITATESKGIIPFGNDYLFLANGDGSIKSWKKFHSILIAQKMPKGYDVLGSMHTHLPREPYITATDICTFRIYGARLGHADFSVISGALDKIFRYNLAKNEITIEDMPGK